MPGCALEGRKAVDSYAVTEANDGIFVYVPSKERPAPPALNLPAEFSDPAWSSILCMGHWLQLPLRLRQFRRSDACLLPARRFLHARVRRQAGRDAGREARRRLLCRPGRAEGRQSRLDPRGGRRHPGLLPARHSLSERRRARRTVPHHRLRHAGRRGLLHDVLLALPPGRRPRQGSPGASSIAPPWRRGIGTCSSRTGKCSPTFRPTPTSARCSTSTTSASRCMLSQQVKDQLAAEDMASVRTAV